MMETIRATHVGMDPIMGRQPPTVHKVTVASSHPDCVAQALIDLFRKFDLPNGGTLTVEGYGKSIRWDYHDFLVPLARHLLGN